MYNVRSTFSNTHTPTYTFLWVEIYVFEIPIVGFL